MAEIVLDRVTKSYPDGATAVKDLSMTIADGVVDRSEWNNGGYGNLIEITHAQGIQTRFGHLSRPLFAGARFAR